MCSRARANGRASIRALLLCATIDPPQMAHRLSPVSEWRGQRRSADGPTSRRERQ